MTAAQGVYRFQAGAFPGSPVMNGCLCGFAPYHIEIQHTVGYDVVSNRPKAAAYRAPGSSIAAFGVESVIDILAKKIGMDPAQIRATDAAHIGAPSVAGPKLAFEGYNETVQAILDHPGYKTKLDPNQGRGVASGYWFNGAGESSATVFLNTFQPVREGSEIFFIPKFEGGRLNPLDRATKPCELGPGGNTESRRAAFYTDNRRGWHRDHPAPGLRRLFRR